MRLFNLAVAVTVLLAFVAALTVVDLSPKVESDFFFSTDDPQLQSSQRIAELFPSPGQLLISATAPDIADEEYIERVRALTEALEALDAISSVQSITHGPSTPKNLEKSPLWSRLLLGTNPNLTQIVAFVDADAGPGEAWLPEVEALLEQHHRAAFSLDMSGVPYVVELVRRALGQDLKHFSAAALLIFGLLISLMYRSVRIVVGTLATCFGACASTLVILALLDAPIGLLTANIITIVFVLTLSHIVFMTANLRVHGELDTAVRRTFEASLWCMVTTLLGFGSLLFADAKPLRELGLAGAVGAVTALVVAFGIYPLFLGRAESLGSGSAAGHPTGPGLALGSRLALGDRLARWGLPVTVVTLLLTLVLAPGLGRLDTDPSLLSYFDPDGELREGLERIDQNGGSSPMTLVVADPDGARLDTPEVQKRMVALQESLDADPEVGTCLSLPVLLAEARLAPLAFLLDASRLIDILESPAYANVAASFVTPDRTQGLYFLRMHESDRQSPRDEVVERLTAHAGEHGLEARWVGGLYPLQAALGDLVQGSVLLGLAGLLALFVVVAFVVSRDLFGAAAMILSLAAIPVLLLGALGYAGVAVDVISSPAANVAIALGIDAMIHLTTAARRRRSAGDDPRQAWRRSVDELGPAIAGASAILSCGFGIFILSSFPPTARFGLSVAAGTLIAALMALVVLPYLGGLRRSGASEPAA